MCSSSQVSTAGSAGTASRVPAGRWPARGPGAEGQRRAARGQGSSAGVWQVGVNRAGVVWRPKDRALRDWNVEQNVTEGTQGKNVVAERTEVLETAEEASCVERGDLLMGGRSLGRVSPGPRWAVVPVPLEELLGQGRKDSVLAAEGPRRQKPEVLEVLLPSRLLWEGCLGLPRESGRLQGGVVLPMS